jgi:aminomethyltransferase
MTDEPRLPPHYQQPLLPTPFHQRARALSQVDSFIPWSGYTTVDVFTTVEQEYFAIRNAATLYDLTPMVKYRVTGPDAQRYLNRLVTRDMSKLKLNRVCYCVWCDDSGHVIDDGTLFRLGENEYRLCTAERQIDWLLDSARGFDVAVAEVTEQIAALALQGPTSCAVLKQLGLAGIEQLKPFEVGNFEGNGLQMTVSRTGFTGDLGYELWVAPDDAVRLWDTLMTRGQSRGIRPIGSRALNLARIEAGFLAPNVDFVSAERTLRVGSSRSPFELGLGWLVDFGKGHFAPATCRARHRWQQAGCQCVAVRRPVRAQGGRQRVVRDVVADLQAQPRARHGRRTAHPCRQRGLGGGLPEPGTGLGATHVPRASGRAALLRT